jgi:hypothetical protein
VLGITSFYITLMVIIFIFIFFDVKDMRGPTCAMRIDDNGGNAQWGIRSVDIFHHFVSIGGGFGRLSFYDLRNKSYIGIHFNKTKQKNR